MRQLARPFSASIRRDWLVARTYRFVLIVEIFSTVIGLALYYYIGQAFDGDSALPTNRFPDGYFAFAAVGMSTFIVISNSLSAPASRVREGQANGTLEALLTTPPRGSQLFLAAGAYDVLRSVVTSAVTLAAAVVVFGLSITANAAATAALAVGLLGGVVAGSALGLVIAAATLVLRRGDTLTGFAVTILALGSGVYYPTDVLPQGLRQIADALPTAWAVDLARVGLLDGKFQAWQAAGLAVAASLMLVASTVVLEASLRYARRQGTLARV